MQLKDHYIPVNRMIDNWRTSQQEAMPVSNLPYYAPGDYVGRTDKGGHFPCRPATQLYAHKERGLYGTFNNNKALVSPIRVWKPTGAARDGGVVFEGDLFYCVDASVPTWASGIITAFMTPQKIIRMTPDGKTHVLHDNAYFGYNWLIRTSSGVCAQYGGYTYVFFQPPDYKPRYLSLEAEQGIRGRPFRSHPAGPVRAGTYGLINSGGGTPLKIVNPLPYIAVGPGSARVDQNDFEYQIPEEMDSWGDGLELGPFAINPYSVYVYWWTDVLDLVTANMYKSVPTGERSGSGVPLTYKQHHSGYLYDNTSKQIIKRFDGEQIGEILHYKGLDYFCGDVLYQYDGSMVSVAKQITNPFHLYLWHDKLWVNSAEGVFFYDGNNDAWFHTVGFPSGGQFMESGNSLFTGSGAIFEDPNGALA